MGTRPGDLDPGAILYLVRHQSGDPDPGAVTESILNHSSGITALSNLENDMQVVRQAARSGDTGALLALSVFTRSITKAIGGFCWLLGGLDAIVFTGGIGEHDAATRSEVLSGLEEQGVALDSTLNTASVTGMHRINSPKSNVAIFVIPTQEDRMIAVHVSQMIQSVAS